MPRALSRTWWIGGIIATLVLSASSLTIGAILIASPGDTGSGTACSPQSTPGTVVDIVLSNMGGANMRPTMPMGGVMRLTEDRATVPHGRVTLVATNTGSVSHELVILPLHGSTIVGTRNVGGDDTVSEDGKLAEASTSCGAGSGEGIAPGTTSWVTITLKPGRYELLCNLPGHYRAGMYAQLTVE